MSVSTGSGKVGASATRRDFVASALGAAAVGAIGFSRTSRGAGEGEAITQTAKFSLDPAREAEAVAALSELVAAVEANEPGVLAYICHRPVDAPGSVFFFEIYRDAAALEGHGKQPHLAKLGQAFGSGLFSGPVEVVKMGRVAGFSR